MEDVVSLIKALLAAGADANLGNAQGRTPLVVAVALESEQLCMVLLGNAR